MEPAPDDVSELESRQEPRLVRALEMVAPGTAVREGIEHILHAHTGALICIGDSDELSFLYSGGVKLDVDYAPAMLYQLAKMDGAITLSENATKIQWANVQLMPDPTIASLETGTRHRTAGSELVTRMAVEIERYIVELGTEGRLIEMQLEEVMVGVATERGALVHDYMVDDSEEGFALVLDSLARLPHQDLLDFGRLAELLGYDRKVNTLDHPVSPRGHRILGRIPRLPKLLIQRIVSEFGGLEEILAANDAELEAVEGVGDVRAKEIREGLRRLQEINLVDRYLQT
jgi:diadenylate cyclase